MIFKNVSNKTRAVCIGILILVAYSMLASEVTESKTVVMLADIISGLAVTGIAVLIYPLFARISKGLSTSYLLLKIIEGGLMIIGGFYFLQSSSFREWSYNGPHLYAFIIGAYLFYYLLYRTRIIPRFISIWGGIAISALLLKTVLGWVDISSSVLDTLLILIITNEVFLAIWLMAKKFHLPDEKTLDSPSGK